MKLGLRNNIATAIALGATPGGGGDCAWPDCFPDASNTGVPAGTSLTAYGGPTTITADDTVIDSKIVNSCLDIDANNVIIRNSQITCATNTWVIEMISGSILIEDCEISCGGINGNALWAVDMTVRRCDITACENGFDFQGPATIEDCYVHGLNTGGGAHTDGFQINQIAGNVNIIHNTVVSSPGANSCIIFWDGANPQNHDVLVEHNLLLGDGCPYAIFMPNTGPLTNVRIINNTVQTGEFGYASGPGGLLTDGSGNIDYVTGDPIAL